MSKVKETDSEFITTGEWRNIKIKEIRKGTDREDKKR